MLKNFQRVLHSRALKVIALLLALYLLLAYFAVDPLARRLLPWVAEHTMASRASVERVRFDPLRLTLTLDKLRLTRADGAPLAGFDRLYLNLETSGLFRFAWRIKDIRLVAPQVTLEIAEDGTLNWSQLIAKLNEDKEPSSTMPRVLVDHILIERGNIQYSARNRPTPFQASLQPLGLELEGLSTLPEDRGEYQIVGKMPDQGGTLKWKGDIALNPIASNGSIAIEGIRLAKLMQIVPAASLPVEISAGELASGFNYRFAMVEPAHSAASQKTAKSSTTTSPVKPAPATETSSPKPEATITHLAFKLDQVKGRLAANQASELAFGQLDVELPQLTFSMRDTTQLQWQGMNIRIKDIAMHAANQELFKLPQANITGMAFDLATNKLNVAEIVLAGGAVHAQRSADGSLNWQQLLANKQAQADAKTSISKEKITQDKNTERATEQSQPSQPAFSFDIASIRLNNWKLGFQDMAFKHPLNLDLADVNVGMALSNADGDVTVQQVGIEAGPLSVTSALSPQAAASLAKFSLHDGNINLNKQSINLASIVLSGLEVQVLRSSDSLLNWQTLLEPATAAATTSRSQQLEIPQVDPQQAQTANALTVDPHSANPNTGSWQLALARISLEKSAVHFNDSSTAKPVKLDIQDAGIELRDILLNPNKSDQNKSDQNKSEHNKSGQNKSGQAKLDALKPIQVSASFKVQQGGQFDASGMLSIAPLKADLKLKLSALSLKPFAPYINQYALLRLNDGSASTSGKLAFGKTPAKTVTSIQYQGGFSINDLAISEENGGATFLGWKSLSSDSLKLSPDQLHMEELRIVQPVGKIIIFEDKTVNVQRILRKPAPTAAIASNSASNNAAVIAKSRQDISTKQVAKKDNADSSIPAQATADQAGFPVSVERIKIDKGELEFADLSLKPQFGTYINTLSGYINGLSSNPASQAQVELDGKVDEFGSARIRGSIQPFRATEFTDLKLAFHNLDMSRLTPYSGKFAGRRIESGKMSVDLEYNIKKRQLAGANKFVINKLKLGEHVDSPDAVNLPLDLAIALLEDSDGVIDLDLPVAGSLDDPQFSYGKVIWKAFVNVLGKIVTSPFRALGNLLGVSSDKLEGVAFDAGSDVLAAPEQEKLKKLGAALLKRPSLVLTIVPGYNPVADTKAIQQATIRRDVTVAMGVKLEPDETPGPLDLSNTKVQSAIYKLSNERSPEAKNKKMSEKMLAKFKDLVTTSKPTEPAAYEAMLQQLQSWVSVTDDTLKALADKRANSMLSYLEQSANLGAGRVNKSAIEAISGQADEVQVKMKLGTSKQ